MISERVRSISASMTLAISAKAKKMRKEGIDVVGFGAGEPDFGTPAHICEAAIAAVREGFTRYTPSSGTPELKQAICTKLERDNNLKYQVSQVIVSCGAKHSLFNVILSLCNKGDEVIIPSPYWVSYPEMVKAAEGIPVLITTDETQEFKISASQLEEAISPRTKAFILNSPANPTGVVYTEEELLEIARVVVDHKIICISDEIYEKIIYDGLKHISIASLGKDIKKQTVLINGVSKAYAMTGWRIGYAVAENEELIKAMSNLQSHSTSNPSSISQKAAQVALEGPQGCVEEMVAAFRERRDFIVKEINSIKGISCIKPEGAFYVFASIKSLLGKKYRDTLITDSLQFSQLLLDEAKVAVVPGAVFGAEGYLRFSYATDKETIAEGMKRIKEFVKNIR